MNKTILISIAFLSVVGLSLIFLITNRAEAPENSASTKSSAESIIEPNTIDAKSQQPAGVYLDYSASTLASAKGNKVLFFHAPWCAQCRSIESGILSQGVPKGISIVKVDYDSNQNLRKKYGVTLQTTFVKIDDNGNLIDKYVAYDEPTFDAVKQNFL